MRRELFFFSFNTRCLRHVCLLSRMLPFFRFFAFSCSHPSSLSPAANDFVSPKSCSIYVVIDRLPDAACNIIANMHASFAICRRIQFQREN